MISREKLEQIREEVIEIDKQGNQAPEYMVLDEQGWYLRHSFLPFVVCEGAGFSIPGFPDKQFVIEEIEPLEPTKSTLLHVRTDDQSAFFYSILFLFQLSNLIAGLQPGAAVEKERVLQRSKLNSSSKHRD